MLTKWTFVVLALSQLAPIKALDNGLALTPPMGWISWARFTCTTDCDTYPDDCISSELYKSMADRLVDDGYKDKGYNYVNIDDCWSERERETATGSLVPDKARFSDGIDKLADYMHDRGLKLGIYGDCGTKTCAGYPAQLKSEEPDKLEDNYFNEDANQLAEWKVDSFKFDGCNLDPTKAESICPKMAQALNATERPVLVVCEWPYYMLKELYKTSGDNNDGPELDKQSGSTSSPPPELSPNFELAQEACNAWRYYEDVEDSWLSILGIIDFTVRMQDTIVNYHGPGHWFDPDQLVIGNFALSLDQARAQMAIWSLWSAPLYMSNDLRQIEPEMAALLKNEKLIAVDQDRLGVFGLLVGESGNGKHQAFAKPVEPIQNGCPSYVVVYLNRDTLGNTQKLSFKVRDLLTKLPIELAAQRYAQNEASNQLNKSGAGGSKFDASNCSFMLNEGMTKPAGSSVQLNTPLNQARKGAPTGEREFYFKVEDLFGDDDFNKVVALNGSLTLRVNPSGVRAVKLFAI